MLGQALIDDQRYGASDSVHSSDSPRRQIDDSDVMKDLNRLPAEDPLHA